MTCTTAILPRSWMRSPLSRRLQRRILCQARRTRLGAMACQREDAAGHARHAHRWFCARQGQIRGHRIRATDERTGPRYPLLLTTGAFSASTMSARRRAAPTISSGTKRTGWKCIPMTPSSAAYAMATGSGSRAGRRNTLRALITERVAPGVVYTTFHHPDTQATSSPRSIPTGPPTARNTRSRRCRFRRRTGHRNGKRL